MRIYKIRPHSEPPWLILTSLDGVCAELESGNLGDTWEIEIGEMTPEALDTLPEFDGW